MMLMRLPGEPAKPAALAHSLVILCAVLAETDALDRASSIGEGVGLTWSGRTGLMSGVLIGGVDSFEVGRLLTLGADRLLLLLLLLLPGLTLTSGVSQVPIFKSEAVHSSYQMRGG